MRHDGHFSDRSIRFYPFPSVEIIIASRTPATSPAGAHDHFANSRQVLEHYGGVLSTSFGTWLNELFQQLEHLYSPNLQ